MARGARPRAILFPLLVLNCPIENGQLIDG